MPAGESRQMEKACSLLDNRRGAKQGSRGWVLGMETGATEVLIFSWFGFGFFLSLLVRKFPILSLYTQPQGKRGAHRVRPGAERPLAMMRACLMEEREMGGKRWVLSRSSQVSPDSLTRM